MESAVPETTVDEWNDEDELEESHNGVDVSRATTTSGRETSSRTNAGDQNEEDGAKQIRAALSKAQSKNVFRLRLWLLAVLCLACGVLGTIMYQLASQAEMDTFESQYDGAAAKLIDGFEAIMDHMGAVASLGMAYSTIVAASDKQQWPLVSLDDFYEMANHARHLSGALAISMHPIVVGEHYGDWNQYATNKSNQEWIVDDIAHIEQKEEHGDDDHHGDEHDHGDGHGHRRRLRGLGSAGHGSDGGHGHNGVEDHHGDHDETLLFSTKSTEIQEMHYFNMTNSLSGSDMWVTEQPGQSVYLPRWQASPFVGGDLVNYNLLKDEDTGEPAEHVMHSGKVVIGGYLDAPPGNTNSRHPTTALLATLEEIKHHGDDDQSHHGHAEGGPAYPGDPMSYVFLPVFDKVAQQGRYVVGVITALVHWLDFFSDILPDSVPAITIVLQYECQDGFVHDHSGTLVSYEDYFGVEDEGHQGHHRRRALHGNETEAGNHEMQDHSDGDQMGASPIEDHAHNEGLQMQQSQTMEHNHKDNQQGGEPQNQEHDQGGHQIVVFNHEEDDSDHSASHLNEASHVDEHGLNDGHQIGASNSGESDHHEGEQMGESNNEEDDNHGHQMGESANEDHGHHGGHHLGESDNEENDHHDGQQMGESTAEAEHDYNDGHHMGASNNGENDHHEGEAHNEEHDHNASHHDNNGHENHAGHHDGEALNEDHGHSAGHHEGESNSAEHAHDEDHGHSAGHHDGGSHGDHEGSKEHDQHHKEDVESVKVSGLFTYRVEGSKTLVVGSGDLHDPKFDKWRRDGRFEGQFLDDGTSRGIPIDDKCSYRLQAYPSQEFVDRYITIGPLVITTVIVAVFVFAILVFCLYDRVVDHRQQLILSKATQSTALVASLFPKNVREKLLKDNDEEAKKPKYAFKDGLRSSMRMCQTGSNTSSDAAIAELFPHCTVFFADIAGFTAWSSTREPAQVFKLLQSVYQAFDALAKRRRVFKVETIGDSYLAVTGLPLPQHQHATIMVRFAWDCLFAMKETVAMLESELGPETSDLCMRFGLHSGPVTAGVLRGDRARFQLFGDTVNTASRMESTGVRGMVQVSESTAAYLRNAGKDSWLVARDDAVKAKGKGVLATYWAVKPSNVGCSTSGSSCGDDTATRASFCSEFSLDLGLSNNKLHGKERLVDWVVQLFLEDVKRVVFARGSSKRRQSKTPNLTFSPPEGQTCLQEIKEIIEMPKTAKQSNDFEHVEIDDDVVRELGEFVTGIALMYQDNPFHNFEHACHVTMSVKKLLKRIVTREMPIQDEAVEESQPFAMQQLHDFTHGLSSDPLCMLAMTFSALIHDVDHRGISNNRLAEEHPEMATKYNNKSIAEQNSLDLAWELLMEDRFATLRSCLFGSKRELLRFRQFIVNVVLATDIFDPELNGLRKKRWAQAFDSTDPTKPAAKECAVLDSDRRATIVIEHIIQASDVSHTMQHWHIYQKWNRCLFNEMGAAYKAGRFPKDPVSFWYKGELGFFDNYIIPLAKKLEQCGVFGVSSDEYLNYALQNRAEWEDRGAGIVAEWVAERERGPVRRERTQVERLSVRHSHHRPKPDEIESSLNGTSPESISDSEDEAGASSKMDADRPSSTSKEDFIKPPLDSPASKELLAYDSVVEC